MYRTAYQRGMLTVFYSGGSKPLEIWDTQTKNGYIKRFLDQDIKTMVLEIRGTNISTTYIICPKGNQVLGIFMPFLVMIVKNLNKYFSFEVTILDETGTRRRFRVSNFQSTTQILPLCTVMPIGLSNGWNQIQFNLAEFTRRAYKKEFVEVQKLKINANIRLRRIYFAERLMSEDELPPAYKLYFPLQSTGKKGAKQAPAVADTEEVQKIQAVQKILSSQAVPRDELEHIQIVPAEEVPTVEVPTVEPAAEEAVVDVPVAEVVVAEETAVEEAVADKAPEESAPDAPAEPGTDEPKVEEATGGEVPVEATEAAVGEATDKSAPAEPVAEEPKAEEPPKAEE